MSHTKRLALLGGAICLFAMQGLARDSRGQILGRVTDPSGAVIVGATVRPDEHRDQCGHNRQYQPNR